MDGKPGAELMPPMCILEGTTDRVLENVLRDLIAAGVDLREELQVNPEARRVMRKTAKGETDITIDVDSLPPTQRAKPTHAWLTNFIWYFPIEEKYGKKIDFKDPPKYLPYFIFKDGQTVTCTVSHWQRAETMLFFYAVMVNPEIARRREILTQRGIKNLNASWMDDGYGVHHNIDALNLLQGGTAVVIDVVNELADKVAFDYATKLYLVDEEFASVEETGQLEVRCYAAAQLYVCLSILYVCLFVCTFVCLSVCLVCPCVTNVTCLSR